MREFYVAVDTDNNPLPGRRIHQSEDCPNIPAYAPSIWTYTTLAAPEAHRLFRRGWLPCKRCKGM
jgi:hypothetical protein